MMQMNVLEPWCFKVGDKLTSYSITTGKFIHVRVTSVDYLTHVIAVEELGWPNSLWLRVKGYATGWFR